MLLGASRLVRNLRKTTIRGFAGSVTALLAVGGACAADLPVRAKAVEYVKVCSAYGVGFYFIPGTDTCIKLGGYIISDIALNSNTVDVGNYSGQGGAKNRFSNAYTWRSRSDLTIDTRTATEYGVARTYFETVVSWVAGSYAGNGTGSTVYDGAASNNATAGAIAGGQLGVYYAFIQFAGFTMGKAVSQFSAPWGNYPGNLFDGLVGAGGAMTGVNQFTYTADFGQGITASVSAQDQVQYNQAGVNNINTGAPFGSSDYAGTISPDFISMVRVDQAWGVLQASVALHDNHAAYYGGAGIANGGTELAGHPQDKWGWAGQLVLAIKNIPTGPGDTIIASGVYTNGATRYNIQDLGAMAGSAMVYGGTSLAGAYQSVGYGVAPDTVFGTLPDGTNSGQQLVSTWGFSGAHIHNWNRYWSSIIYGGYAAVSYNGTAKTLICGVNGVGGSFRNALRADLRNCNPDYNISQLGLTVAWTPVKDLTFAADLTYTMLDQKMVGTVNAASLGIGKPSATYELKDQSNLKLLLRAQRTF